MRRPAVALALVMLAAPVWSQQVALGGLSGNKALLIIDGAPPRFVAPGQSVQGVKLLSASADEAVVEVDGRRQVLRLGAAPAAGAAPAGPAEGGRRLVLTADSRGHFVPAGQINGRAVQFIVDTGATQVSLGESEAQRLGISTQGAPRVNLGTANGVVVGHRVKLDSVRVGELLVYGVDAVVLPQPLPYVLLGNSFLNRFQMQRTNDQLVLERRF